MMTAPFALWGVTTALVLANLVLLFRLGRRLRRQHRSNLTQLLLINRRLLRQPYSRPHASADPPLDPTAGFRDPCR